MKEVVVVFAPSASGGQLESPSAAATETEAAAALESILSEFGADLQPVFEPSTASPGLEATAASESEVELSRYYRTEVDDEAAERLAGQLNSLPHVEGAFVKPEVENPIAPFDQAEAAASPPFAPPQAAAPPNFVSRQGYVRSAPGGVDAAAAWSRPGGRGDQVNVIDIEGGWCLTHLDLQPNGGLAGGTAYPGSSWRDHGTAVLGEIAATDNGFGVTGIAPNAKVSAVSHGTLGSARAIQHAARLLAPGDLLLLEMHRPGPRHAFASRPDQRGYIAVEWWPDDFLAIRFAVERGVIVIEAAGNGAEDLNDALYNAPGAGFPATWQNPFAGAADSGAILVGAGAPPSGAYGPDRSRLSFSNHGTRLDCQGWGAEVVTTGYGDLYQGSGEDEWYTAKFSGTSSASPIVTGVVACMQGIGRQVGRPLTPARARRLLQTTGSPQQASPASPLTQHIGSRPDLAALVPLI
jgi:hypothetical protein